MAYYIVLPLKKTSEVDMVKPLKNMITWKYNSYVAAVYTDALNELNELRMNSTSRTFGNHESSLKVMCRYCDQLLSLESKFSLSDTEIPFEWKDAFEKGKPSLTISSLAYERVCILFNMAAMQSQIAATEGDVNSNQALKTAAKYFQLSSDIFHYLRKTISSLIQQDLTPDLHPDTLSALQILMLAQVQEVFFNKVVKDDKVKNGIIAKVASRCEECYAEALKQMQKESTRMLWEKNWIKAIGARQAHFRAVAEKRYYQSQVCKEEINIGEELFRLQDLVGSIPNYWDDRGWTIKYLKEWVERIHHALAEATPLSEIINPSSRDMFRNLLLVFKQQKALTVNENEEVRKMKEGTQMMNEILASLNLPAAIEDVSGDSIPQSLKEKANLIREKGGLAYVSSLIKELPELLQRNKEILDEVDQMLKEEEDTDSQLHTKFKDKWTYTSSDNLNGPLKENITKYREMISIAMNTDAIVREKYNKHKDMIDLLSKSGEEMLPAIPSAAPAAALSSIICVQELRRLMAEVEEIKRERETLEEKLKTITVDMGVKLSIDTRDHAQTEEVLPTEIVLKMFGPIRQLVRENLKKQKRVMAQVQAVNTEFCKVKDKGSAASQREAIFRDLAAAYNAYMELCSDLEERKKLYNDLMKILINLRSKIRNTPTLSTSTIPSAPPYVPPSDTTTGMADHPPNTACAGVYHGSCIPTTPERTILPSATTPTSSTSTMPTPPPYAPPSASSMGVGYPPYQYVQYYEPPPPYTPYAEQQPVPHPPAPFQQTTYFHPYPGYPQQQQPGANQYPQQKQNWQEKENHIHTHTHTHTHTHL